VERTAGRGHLDPVRVRPGERRGQARLRCRSRLRLHRRRDIGGRLAIGIWHPRSGKTTTWVGINETNDCFWQTPLPPLLCS